MAKVGLKYNDRVNAALDALAGLASFAEELHGVVQGNPKTLPTKKKYSRRDDSGKGE